MMMEKNAAETMRAMVDTLNKWTEAYDKGEPVVSDKSWDEVYFNLMALEKEAGFAYPDSPTQAVRYEIVNSLRKVTHNHPMLSLDKTKDWNEFLSYFESGKDVVGMLKLDGLTCSLHYINGELVGAETRGNGEVGEDILHNAKVLPSIPKYIHYKQELIIDGEIICKERDFKEFANDYANSRNFSSGSIRLLDSRECSKRKLTFVVWNIVKGFEELNSVIDRFNAAHEFGFEIVPWVSSFDFDAKEYLVELAETYGYPIDGLVGRYDDITYGESLGATGHHSRAAYAFKFYDEEYDTELVDIEYDVSRNGEMVPVAVFVPVDDGVSEIGRASLHNLSIVESLLKVPYKGQKIRVAKMNQIIPQVVWAEHLDQDDYISVPEVCPVCGGETKILTSETGVNSLYCANKACPRRLVNVLDHFCGKKGLDIKGISKATIRVLINREWLNNIVDIFNLHSHYEDWIKLPGFGVKSVTNILENIENTKQHINLSNFIAALGIPGIGTTAARQLADEFTYYSEFRDAVKSGWDFTQLKDFGYVTNQAIVNFDYTEADEIYNIVSDIAEPPKCDNDASLQGLTFVITGKLVNNSRDGLKELIKSHGGKVTDSVSKNTSYLINNDINSNSSKNRKAKELDVIIITEEEFMDMIK